MKRYQKSNILNLNQVEVSEHIKTSSQDQLCEDALFLSDEILKANVVYRIALMSSVISSLGVFVGGIMSISQNPIAKVVGGVFLATGIGGVTISLNALRKLTIKLNNMGSVTKEILAEIDERINKLDEADIFLDIIQHNEEGNNKNLCN